MEEKELQNAIISESVKAPTSNASAPLHGGFFLFLVSQRTFLLNFPFNLNLKFWEFFFFLQTKPSLAMESFMSN